MTEGEAIELARTLAQTERERLKAAMRFTNTFGAEAHYAAKDLTRLKQLREADRVYGRMLANAAELAEAVGGA
jgi:hypothetical protein